MARGLFCFALVACYAIASAEDASGGVRSSVLQTNDNSLEQYIRLKPLLMVQWCAFPCYSCRCTQSASHPAYNLRFSPSANASNCMVRQPHANRRYAPWCQYCQKFEPEYEEAAKALQLQGHRGILARINGEENAKSLAKVSACPFPWRNYA